MFSQLSQFYFTFCLFVDFWVNLPSTCVAEDIRKLRNLTSESDTAQELRHLRQYSSQLEGQILASETQRKAGELMIYPSVSNGFACMLMHRGSMVSATRKC